MKPRILVPDNHVQGTGNKSRNHENVEVSKEEALRTDVMSLVVIYFFSIITCIHISISGWHSLMDPTSLRGVMSVCLYVRGVTNTPFSELAN